MKTKIIVTLSALVIGLSGYLLYESFNTEMSEVEIRTQFSDLKTEYQKMQGDLDKVISDLEINNEEIITKKKEIEVLVSKNNVTEEELGQAKKLMKNLSEVVLKSYKNKVDVLEKYQVDLFQEKSKLTEDIQKFQKRIVELDDQYKKEKRNSDKKDKIIHQKEEEVSYASRLILSNFVLKGFKIRSSVKEVQTDKASRIDQIKVSFDIVPNKLAESGVKNIYTVITKPSGEVVTFVNKDTGEFVFENKKMKYSDELRFPYTQGEEKNLEFAWNNEEFERGDYRVEVYEKTPSGVVLIGKAIKSLR